MKQNLRTPLIKTNTDREFRIRGTFEAQNSERNIIQQDKIIMNNGQGFFQSHAYIQNTVQRISRYDNFTSSDVEKCQDETSSVTNTSPSNSKTIPYSSKSSSGIDPHERMVITVTGKPSSERKSKENSIKFPSKVRRKTICILCIY